MPLRKLRLGPKATSRDVALALEAIERFVNQLAIDVNALEEQDAIDGEEPPIPPTTTVNWNDIEGKPTVFPAAPHIHEDSLGVREHGSDPFASRPPYPVVLWIGTTHALGPEDGGNALDEDIEIIYVP